MNGPRWIVGSGYRINVDNIAYIEEVNGPGVLPYHIRIHFVSRSKNGLMLDIEGPPVLAFLSSHNEIIGHKKTTWDL